MRPSASPTGLAKNEFICYVRGFSMLAIVVHHCLKKVLMPQLLYTAFFFGGSGIHAFIFVSGYGLAQSRVTSRKEFYGKRFRKVLFPYYVGITLIFGGNLILPIYGDDWRAYLSHLLLYKMFVERYNGSFGGQFWFISTIVQFYVFFPLISQWLARTRPLYSLGVAGLLSLSYGLLVLVLGRQHDRIWACSAVQYGWEFVLGMVVARQGWLPRLLRQPNWLYGGLFVAGVIGTVLLVSYAGLTGRQFNDFFAFVGFLSGCLLLYKLSERQWMLSVLKRFVFWIEPFSYGLFITHVFVLDAYNEWIGQPNLIFLDLLWLGPALLLVAWTFHHVVTQLMERKTKPISQPALP